MSDKKIIRKKPISYILDIKKFSHEIVELTLDLSSTADEKNIKRTVDILIEKLKQTYTDIKFVL